MKRLSSAKCFSFAAFILLTISSISNSFAYDLPENTLKWEVIPSAIRADGSDSFVIEVYSPQSVSSIKLSKMPSDINDGDYVKPTSGYFFSSIALKDDGAGADRIAGDNIYTAGPFVYDTSKAFPADGFEGVDGIYNDAVGDIQITFTDSQYTYASNGIFVRVGLVRDDIADVETTDLSEKIQASPYVINMMDDNYASERRLRQMMYHNRDDAAYDQTKELYSVFEDEFDQLLIYSTATLNDISIAPKTSIKGYHYPVKNDIEGIGLNIFDNSNKYGAFGQLDGINYFCHGRLDSHLVIHEITHQWEAHLKSPIDGIKISNGHWEPFVSWYPTKVWEKNYDGTFTLRYQDNPLDKDMLKYLMGYSYYTDIAEELHVADKDSSGDFNTDRTITKIIHSFTMEDIVAKNGIRTPGPESAQRDFKAAVIFSTAGRKFNATEMTFASIYAQNIGNIVGEKLFDSNWVTALPAFPDNTPPVITLNGEALINVVIGSEFTDPGARAVDNMDGDISDQIITEGSVDTSTLGTYVITYNVSDSSQNHAVEVTRTVNVIEEPVCEAITATNSEHEAANRAYSETVIEGQTCWGSYCWGGTETTTWYAQGSNENLGTNGSASTTLHESSEGVWETGACPGPDVTVPVITLLGDNPMTVYQNSEFTDPGATAVDNVDGDITANINVTGEINTSVINTYELVYTVADAAGNEATAIRTIQVIAQPACTEYTDTISNHESAGRAYSVTETTGQTCWGSYCWGGTETTTWYAQGSDENLGTNGSATVTLIANNGGYVTGNCPTDPVAPVIESFDIVSLDYYGFVITGTASDADGDIEKVALGTAASGVDCRGTTEFTCRLSYEEFGFQVGATVTFAIGAKDSRNEWTYVYTDIIRPENQAPVIESYSITKLTNEQAIVSGRASDKEGRLDRVVLGLGVVTGIECNGTTTFTCILDYSVHDIAVGEAFPVTLAVWDTLDVRSEEVIEFTITRPEEQASVPPEINNVQHTRNGSIVTVTADVTDPDGDLQYVGFSIVDGGFGGVECVNTGGDQYTCTVELQGMEYGVTHWKVRAVDIAHNETFSTETVTVEWQEEVETCFTATNSEHINAGRAELQYNVLVYAIGSGDYLGMSGDTTSLDETSAGVWTKVTSCN